MEALFATGRIVDLILAFMVVEAIVLVAWRWRSGVGIAPLDLVVSLFAGVFLLLALRAALSAQPWPMVAAWLAAALVAHVADLARRWRR